MSAAQQAQFDKWATKDVQDLDYLMFIISFGVPPDLAVSEVVGGGELQFLLSKDVLEALSAPADAGLFVRIEGGFAAKP